MSKIAFSCIFFVMLSFTACANRGENQTAAPETINAADLIKQADAAYAERGNLVKARESINLLKRARTSDSKNYEAAWKLAQSCYFVGKFTTDDKESDRAFKEGVEAAKAATRLAPEKPDGYFWTGANLGGQAEKSVLSGLTDVGEIREMMNKTIEIQPNYQAGSAYGALAQIELATRLTSGKPQKALDYLDKATAIDKENSYTHLYLAETYLALDRKADAKKQIEYILNTKPSAEFLPEYADAAAQARKLLETKF